MFTIRSIDLNRLSKPINTMITKTASGSNDTYTYAHTHTHTHHAMH